MKVFKEVDFERMSPYEFLYDIELAYKGTTVISLSTNLLLKIPYIKKNLNVPLNIEVTILALNGTIRLYYNGNVDQQSWYVIFLHPHKLFSFIILGTLF